MAFIEFRRWFNFLALFLLALPVLTHAEILQSTLKIDPRQIILFHTFGFDSSGKIDVNISNMELYHDGANPDTQRMGFFLTTTEAELSLQNDINKGICILEDKNIQLLFTLAEVNSSKSLRRQFAVRDANEYNLFFASCQPHVVLTMNVDLAFYNIESNGRKDYLPAGKTLLPLLYFTFFLAYLSAGTAWTYFCYKQNSNVHRIHVLMGVLVILKALTVLSQGGEYALIKYTGAPHGWNVVYYVFSFLRGVMLFTVIVLIGTGWSFLKPYLQDKEKKVIMIVIPLQVFANVATIILDESGPSSREWFTWRDIFHLLDIICCCAILFPIVWSIKHLREASHTDGKAARNVVKLTLFRQFYVMVVTYIYFTRIVVYLLKSTTPYHYAWTADLASELATLAFYVFTGYKFRPIEHNPYFVIDEEEEAAAIQALKDDDFDL